jgi:signal transduction histidine kinase
MSKSLRGRLLANTILATTVIFLLASCTLYVLIRHAILTEFDNGLLARAQALASLVEQDHGVITIDLDASQIPEFRKGQHPLYYLLWDQHGNIVCASDSVDGTSFPTAIQEFEKPIRWSWMRLPHDISGREVVVRFTPHPEGGGTLIDRSPQAMATFLVASDTLHIDTQLLWLSVLLAVVFGAAILVSAGVMVGITHNDLKPLGVLAQRIQALGHESLSERLDARTVFTEMEPIVDRLNELLANVEAAFARERAFTADVAHELRTPLAGLIMALQIAGTRRRAPEDYENIIGKCSTTANAMRSMVENLLTLARADAHQLQPESVLLDSAQLARDCWRGFESAAESRGLRMRWESPDSLPVHADPLLLTMVFANIFDNAVTYTNDDGCITLRGQKSENTTIFEIENSGSQVRSDDAAKLFDRFWRGDSARTTVGKHFGLGLPLCKRILASLNGSITIETSQGADFRIRLSLG